MTVLHIVCPVYHEQDNILALWREMELHFSFPFLAHFVYDSPDDPTVPVLRTLQDRHKSQIDLLINPPGGALSALKAGIAHSPPGVPVLIMMADLSDDLAIVPTMMAAWERGAKVVVASRYMDGGRQIGGPLIKRWMSALAGKSLYWLGRLPVHDATNNFRLNDSDLLHSISIQSRMGFELAIELTVKAHRAGHPIVEVPATWRDRTAGTSRFRLLKWLPQYLRWYLYALLPRFIHSS
jgi:dolichol-phosphate mannosyltransferase